MSDKRWNLPLGSGPQPDKHEHIWVFQIDGEYTYRCPCGAALEAAVKDGEWRLANL